MKNVVLKSPVTMINRFLERPNDQMAQYFKRPPEKPMWFRGVVVSASIILPHDQGSTPCPSIIFSMDVRVITPFLGTWSVTEEYLELYSKWSVLELG